jgi:TP901 family phage tail tape measure protein
MAAGRKEYELLMKLSAALSSNFNSTFQTAMNTTKKLQDSLNQVKKVQGDISAYKKTQDAIANTRNSVQDLTQRHSDLQQKLSATAARERELQKALEKSAKATGTETEEYLRLEAALKKTQTEKKRLETQVNNASAAIARANTEIEKEENKLADLSQELQAAGINTNKLTQENEKLEKAYQRVQQSQENIARVNQAISENKEAISATKTELTKTIGTVAALGTALAVPIKGAMEFESSMAEVAKVVDWIGTGNGATAEQIKQYNELSEGLYGLTRQIPMTAKEFAEITAAAGQANVAMDNAGLLAFASDAAKMGIAFDISAERAGAFMSQWRTAFGMAQSEVVELSDVINYLGNTTPATAAQISNVVTRIGPLGDVAGLSSKELAALGAAIVGVGIDESVAATGIKNLMLDMTKGTAATKKMHGVLESLGTSATDLAERMQTDATGAIMDFMRAVKQLPEAEQAAALTTYFGQESVAAIAPLLSNLDNLEEQFYKVGDASQYAGSMEREYAARAATSENSFALLKNAVKELSDTFGKIFVPGAESGMQALTEMIYKVTDFVKENPELIKTIGKVVAGLAGLKIAGLGAKLGFLELKGGVLEIQKIFALFKGNVAESAAAAATGGGKIATLGKTLSSYFSGAKSSIGGVGESIDKLAGGKLSGLFSKIGGGIQNGILKPLGGIGNKVTGALGGVGGKITGFFGGIGEKVAAGPLGKLGGVFQSIGSAAGSVLGGPLKGLGSLFGGIFGKAMPVIMIISALSMLFLKLSGEDISGFLAPLQDAFEQLKPVLAAAMEQFKELGKKLLPLLVDVAKQLAPLLGQIITAILPVVLQLIQSIVPLIINLAETLLPAILNVITTLAPLLTQIITAVLPIVVQLLQTLLPIITTLVTSVMPIIVDVLNAILPLITQLIQAVLPVLMTILQALMPVIQVLADLFTNVLGAAIEAIKPIIEAVIGIFGGLVDFITGIFTGNWGKAWDGVVSIFKGIIDGIVAIFKAPINFIIDGINFFLSGLNTLKIPDWVPGIGGLGINIPLIPKLEKGSDFTPDTFIAGDVNGKGGELVTNARGRTVFTAAETSAILDNINAARAITNNAATPPPTITERVGGFISALKDAAANRAAEMGGQPLPPMPSSGGGGFNITIHNTPTIYVDGDTPGDLEEKLKQNNENLLQMFKEFLRQQRENEGRMAYV